MYHGNREIRTRLCVRDSTISSTCFPAWLDRGRRVMRGALGFRMMEGKMINRTKGSTVNCCGGHRARSTRMYAIYPVRCTMMALPRCTPLGRSFPLLSFPFLSRRRSLALWAHCLCRHIKVTHCYYRGNVLDV